MKNTILVIDGGGRGAVLVDKYAQSEHVGKILAVPGNDIMKINSKKPVKTYPDLKTTSVGEILEIALVEKVDLVDVAQDNAVEAGLVDILSKEGLAVIGPTKKAGRIEWDKAWSRKMLSKRGLPQPDYKVFDNFKAGEKYIRKQPNKAWFVKASGLAEGKGALPAKSNKEALERIKELARFGKAAENFLLEEWLVGEEFSSFALCDGKDYQLIGSAQDHKRVNDFDGGENTGGMGCSSPPLVLTKEIKKQVEKIMGQTLETLKSQGSPYKGILYLGGMIVWEKTGPKVYVIEFNARWGDPEAQVLVPGIKGDLFEISMAVSEGKLNQVKVRMDSKARVVVAGASRGYPGDYIGVKGKEIFGLDLVRKVEGVKLFGAGIKERERKYYATGGRLFYLVGEGKNVIEARCKAYEAMSLVSIEGNNLHYRTDIGWRDVQRLRGNLF
ncbi:MAG: phosphoribosylamine--glycine ligase [bacterium]|nr:phosphoribosylamine--glycine ligase [bacterium]